MITIGVSVGGTLLTVLVMVLVATGIFKCRKRCLGRDLEQQPLIPCECVYVCVSVRVCACMCECACVCVCVCVHVHDVHHAYAHACMPTQSNLRGRSGKNKLISQNQNGRCKKLLITKVSYIAEISPPLSTSGL